jgi:hypothetical protein
VDKPTVFISYSHKWKSEIEAALQRASVAVSLISDRS